MGGVGVNGPVGGLSSKMRGPGNHGLMDDVLGKLHIHESGRHQPDLVAPRIIEKDGHEPGRNVKELSDLIGCTDTQLIEVFGCVDGL